MFLLLGDLDSISEPDMGTDSCCNVSIRLVGNLCRKLVFVVFVVSVADAVVTVKVAFVVSVVVVPDVDVDFVVSVVVVPDIDVDFVVVVVIIVVVVNDDGVVGLVIFSTGVVDISKYGCDVTSLVEVTFLVTTIGSLSSRLLLSVV